MTTTIKKKYSLFASALFISLSTMAFENNESGPITVPVLEDAKVFANFNDSTPAVVNYFTSSTEEQIINFYLQNYGEPISQERKRGRLTLAYQQNEQKMRVIISPEGVKHQVDIIVEKAK